VNSISGDGMQATVHQADGFSGQRQLAGIASGGCAAVAGGRGRRAALQEYCRHAAIMENGAKKYIFEMETKCYS